MSLFRRGREASLSIKHGRELQALSIIQYIALTFFKFRLIDCIVFNAVSAIIQSYNGGVKLRWRVPIYLTCDAGVPGSIVQSSHVFSFVFPGVCLFLPSLLHKDPHIFLYFLSKCLYPSDDISSISINRDISMCLIDLLLY